MCPCSVRREATKNSPASRFAFVFSMDTFPMLSSPPQTAPDCRPAGSARVARNFTGNKKPRREAGRGRVGYRAPPFFNTRSEGLASGAAFFSQTGASFSQAAP